MNYANIIDPEQVLHYLLKTCSSNLEESALTSYEGLMCQTNLTRIDPTWPFILFLFSRYSNLKEGRSSLCKCPQSTITHAHLTSLRKSQIHNHGKHQCRTTCVGYVNQGDFDNDIDDINDSSWSWEMGLVRTSSGWFVHVERFYTF